MFLDLGPYANPSYYVVQVCDWRVALLAAHVLLDFLLGDCCV